MVTEDISVPLSLCLLSVGLLTLSVLSTLPLSFLLCLILLMSFIITSLWKLSLSPSGVRDVDSSEVDALTAHDEQRGEAEQGDSAADHGQLGRLAGSQFQLLNDVATQHDAHASAGHNDHT